MNGIKYNHQLESQIKLLSADLFLNPGRLRHLTLEIFNKKNGKKYFFAACL